jgi:hypothetical protein
MGLEKTSSCCIFVSPQLRNQQMSWLGRSRASASGRHPQALDHGISARELPAQAPAMRLRADAQ